MIITCPNCKKKFKIDFILIPEDGRNLKCGLCDHVWLYKVEDVNSSPLTLDENINNSEIEPDDVEIESADDIKQNKLISENIDKTNDEKNTGGKFFSYLVVFIISFLALIILLDTLKAPLIDVFPGLEIILFSLFETLQDIKLFIIDLY